MRDQFFRVTLEGREIPVLVNRDNVAFIGRGPHDDGSMRIYFVGSTPVCIDVKEHLEELMETLGVREAEPIIG